MTKIIIATRKSPLALWQAKFVQAKLTHYHPKLKVDLLAMTTQGDKQLSSTLSKIGGKGLFVKELEVGMQNGLADMAVHSIKDIPYQLPNGLELGAILARENPYDALVSNTYRSIDDLPQNAKIGTGSLRRQAQLLHARPDLKMMGLRGNVNTRLQKLDAGQYDAIILACAGLIRLGLEHRIAQVIPAEQSLPAVGQGAVGIEIRRDDDKIKSLIEPLIDAKTTAEIKAERAMNARLEGGCSSPIAGFAQLDNNQLTITGLVGDVRGQTLLKASLSGTKTQAQALGTQLADKLIDLGARELLKH